MEKSKASLKIVVATEEGLCDLNSMRTYHQLLALNVLLKEEQVISFEIDSHCATTDEQLDRFEIAKLHNENKVRVFFTDTTHEITN